MTPEIRERLRREYDVPYRGKHSACQHVLDLLAALDSAEARAAEAERKVVAMRKAIGMCVPSIIRCFMNITDSSDDRELAGKVLVRVEAAMAAAMREHVEEPHQ